ncbi:uncharacterized protein RMCC_3150 [Mycolicibacterium canariasense]|uniref:DUF559 domain-containing protein n=1 Tax=Mycolicibacterium canariasense TaxID=228230 RepID=A0A117IAC6_MYCCR|nr:hypothetical protein [Mycolicibacterium canariasense]GAS96184.1 uncharacterized protein RMCC_3150 [Mycolicibacterium canariasense]
MGKLIVGSQARRGGMTGYELRRHHDRVHRDVYAPKGQVLTLADRIAAAWLRSHQGGVIAGVAASALHGACWIDDEIPIELIWEISRPPAGIVVRRDRLESDEVMLAGVRLTTPARTAFDLGRHRPRTEALARMDELQRVTAFDADEVSTLIERHRGARGLKQLRALLPLVDSGAASPQESRLRLLLLDTGFPKPATQLPVTDGARVLRTVDMGWEKFKVVIEYDGDQHRTNRFQYVKDLRVLPRLDALGWNVLRVIKEDTDWMIVERAYRALVARGWDGRLGPAHPCRAGLAAKLQFLRSPLELPRNSRNLAV